MKETFGILVTKPYLGETQAIKKFIGLFQVEDKDDNEKNNNDKQKCNSFIRRIQDYLWSQARASSATINFLSSLLHSYQKKKKKNPPNFTTRVIYPCKVFTFIFLKQSVLSFTNPTIL